MTTLPAAMAFICYEAAWRIAMPLLRHHRRLRDGYEQRILKDRLPNADLWIQAASGGETRLAAEILRRLSPARPLRILTTTNTRQGMEILATESGKQRDCSGMRIESRYFPFDRPSLMAKAVARVRPRLAVLLETELWPGFMKALKQYDIPMILLNARLSPASYRFYARWPGFWRALAPDTIRAVSDADADRYRRLYPDSAVTRMSNIKFDRIQPADALRASADNPLRRLVPQEAPFVVLGSVRFEEAEAVGEVLQHLLNDSPDAVIGLFPRHFHRLGFWETFLDSRRLPWRKRTTLDTGVRSGTVILWDTFGELPDAYALADAAFVGGSLAPLGGQNFLEPLASGLAPVIGPFWDDFKWIGEEIFEKGLVHKAPDARSAARHLATSLACPVSRTAIHAALRDYLKDRQGGADMACDVIRSYLNA